MTTVSPFEFSVEYRRNDKPGVYCGTITMPPVIGQEVICTHWAVCPASSVSLCFRYVDIKVSQKKGIDFEIELEPYNVKFN